MGEWKPIETAPKDGSEILLFCQYEGEPGWFNVGLWEDRGWLDANGKEVEGAWTDHNGPDLYPTHWMPLPDPPSSPEITERED